jgi:hypothetical protein
MWSTGEIYPLYNHTKRFRRRPRRCGFTTHANPRASRAFLFVLIHPKPQIPRGPYTRTDDPAKTEADSAGEDSAGTEVKGTRACCTVSNRRPTICLLPVPVRHWDWQLPGAHIFVHKSEAVVTVADCRAGHMRVCKQKCIILSSANKKFFVGKYRFATLVEAHALSRFVKLFKHVSREVAGTRVHRPPTNIFLHHVIEQVLVPRNRAEDIGGVEI